MQNYCTIFLLRLLICYFLILTPNIQSQTAVVNSSSGKKCFILFTLTNKKRNKFILTRFLIENQ